MRELSRLRDVAADDQFRYAVAREDLDLRHERYQAQRNRRQITTGQPPVLAAFPAGFPLRWLRKRVTGIKGRFGVRAADDCSIGSVATDLDVVSHFFAAGGVRAARSRSTLEVAGPVLFERCSARLHMNKKYQNSTDGRHPSWHRPTP